MDLGEELFEKEVDVKDWGHLKERKMFEEVIYELKSKKNQMAPGSMIYWKPIKLLVEWYNVCFQWE